MSDLRPVMNTHALRTVIDLDNMAMKIQYDGGNPKIIELLTRAARLIEKYEKQTPTAFDKDDEGTPV